MKTILYLILISNLSYATQDPQNFINNHQQSETWFAYKVKAQSGTRSMCCWNNGFKGFDNLICDLNSDNHGYVNSASSPITENINIYVKLKQGTVEKLLSIGDHCPIKSNNLNINWLTAVSQQKSLHWLKPLTSDNKISPQALQAIALHQDQLATGILLELATKNNNINSKEAAFWLGQARNDGVAPLKLLYQTLAQGEVKESIIFALSQARSSEAIKLLQNIATTDNSDDYRGEALFWLAESKANNIIPLLLTAIANDKSQDVRKKAIFALSQLESNASNKALLNIAKNNPESLLKKEALFWLTEKSPKQAKLLIFEILDNSQSKQQLEQAIFNLSRISQNNNDQELFAIVHSNYSIQIKKQALFWLSQSDNPDTISTLQNLL